jgi:hypothetical protein
MTESSRFDIADKIAKLLKKAESATPEEAQLLQEKVQELMEQHSIDAATLDAKRRESGHEGEKIVTVMALSLDGSYRIPLRMLMFVVINTSDNVRGYVMEYNSKRSDVYLVGYESDVKQLQLLLTSLEIQAAMAMRTWWISPKTVTRTRNFTASQKWNERRGFIVGYAAGVRTRIMRVKNAMKSEPGMELVLARKSRVDAHVEATVGELKSTKTVVISSSYNANAKGYTAGLNSNTGDTNVTQRGRLES